MISLLSVEGKIFFSLVARRLSDFLSSNNYIDTLVQKGGISGEPGCLEHTGVSTSSCGRGFWSWDCWLVGLPLGLCFVSYLDSCLNVVFM